MSGEYFGETNLWQQYEIFPHQPGEVSQFVPFGLLPPQAKQVTYEDHFGRYALHRFDLERPRTARDGTQVFCEGELYMFDGNAYEQRLLVRNMDTGEYFVLTAVEYHALVPQTEEDIQAEVDELNAQMLQGICDVRSGEPPRRRDPAYLSGYSQGRI